MGISRLKSFTATSSGVPNMWNQEIYGRQTFFWWLKRPISGVSIWYSRFLPDFWSLYAFAMAEGKLPYIEKNQVQEAVAINNPDVNFVTCLYRAKVAEFCRFVTATWSKNLASHSLSIAIENPYDEEPYICKIDLKTWQFWGKKGLKSFKVEGDQRVDIFWDFRSAKFSSSPEPSSNYYVALVYDKQLVIVLGDQRNEALRRTKSRPSSEEALLLHKKENVFGKKTFCAKTMVGNGEKEHHIIIEASLSGGPFDPEMWIGVDGIELIRISNLHWRFRGNESIVVDDVPIQIYWDVHDWLYSNGIDSGPAMFIFARGLLSTEANSHQDGAYEDLISEEDSSWELPLNMDMCHFLFAWMVD